MSPNFAKWNTTVNKGLEYDPVSNTASTGSMVFLAIALILILIALIWLLKLRIDKKVKQAIEKEKEEETNREKYE